ncbi:Uncharacterised protein [Citrobacter freundii]|nr:Uncharacterised protein [Citrobacter freundii]
MSTPLRHPPPLLVSVVDDIAGGVFNAALSNGQLTNDARPTAERYRRGRQHRQHL